MTRRYVLLAPWIALAALTSASPATAEPPLELKPDVVYFVFGARPDDMMLQLQGVTKKDGDRPRTFKVSFPPSLHRAHDGFVVVKARPGVVMGISTIAMMAGKSIFGISYHPCGKTPVFQATGGKILYITTVEYSPDPPARNSPPPIVMPGIGYMSAGYHLVQDLDGARAFLKTHYPSLADSLEQGQFDLVDVKDYVDCT